MRVSELMTEQVQTVPPTMSAASAWEMMRRERIHHLIVKSGADVIGVLSDKDAGGPHGATVREGSTVGDLMTREVVTVEPETTVRRAANLMRGRSIGCLPVVSENRPVGILTVSDLLTVLGKGVDRPARPTRTTLNHRVPHRKQRAATGKW